jgi:hypothetical protein
MTNDTPASAHTPVPWTVRGAEYGKQSIYGPEGQFVCSVGLHEQHPSLVEANAKLIIAACSVHGELLAALDELLSETLDIDHAQGIALTDREQNAFDRALSVLTKAHELAE